MNEQTRPFPEDVIAVCSTMKAERGCSSSCVIGREEANHPDLPGYHIQRRETSQHVAHGGWHTHSFFNRINPLSLPLRLCVAFLELQYYYRLPIYHTIAVLLQLRLRTSAIKPCWVVQVCLVYGLIPRKWQIFSNNKLVSSEA